MSTWQIFSDAGDNNFRWEISSGRVIPSKSDDRFINSGPPLPSMADLLLQAGSSKLLEIGEREAEKLPLFRTALGKSVVLKESSIAKALSVLDDDGATSSGDMLRRDNGLVSLNSFFQTGSGKSVNISSAGLVRAKKLLGLEEDNAHCNLQGECVRDLSDCTEQKGRDNLDTKEGTNNYGVIDSSSFQMHSSSFKACLAGSDLNSEVNSTGMHYDILNSTPKMPPMKFHTAGGRSLSVSGDALKRARSLLGDPELGNFLDKMDADDSLRKSGGIQLNKEQDKYTPCSHQGTEKNVCVSRVFISPLQSFNKQLRSPFNSENLALGSNLIEKFEAVSDENICALSSSKSSRDEPLDVRSSALQSIINYSSKKGAGSRINPLGQSSCMPLTDISNHVGKVNINNKPTATEKRRLGSASSMSPFKRPRSSKFSTPLNKTSLSSLSSERSCSRRVVSTRYPFQVPRVYIKEYFVLPPLAQSKLEHSLHQVRSDNADKYEFTDDSGNSIGAEGFFHMLVHSGASTQHVSKEWVRNHYKWIVWKLACYDRCYPSKSTGKFLTLSNVLEELKYRYEREVNHGHRSAIKRILDGDASTSSMLVLCISAVHLSCEQKIGNHSMETNGPDDKNLAQVELTDGWYSIGALLDILLSKQLHSGKLFVGQKLRICGAGLSGWVGPISPLEASKSVSLLLNMNGTYRACWADRLGFCKSVGDPLAFRCIKRNGGPVPCTLVGVTRVYPILYKERLTNGKSIVRSEKTEMKMMQLFNQRRSVIAEGILSEYQRGPNSYPIHNDSDSEGAKILKILETAAEPEVLMAEMSPEQLTSFATYKAKLEASRQREIEKTIEKALEDTGLREREVTPFVRVRVTGLTTGNHQGKSITKKEGMITIWNPTEKQQSELVEGRVYVFKGLIPMNSDSETLYLQARGSTTQWEPVPPEAVQHFEPFFNPRKSVSLSKLGEVPLSSEFDIAAWVLYVGEVYIDAQRRKQWVFVTDGSVSDIKSGEISNSLLAINFCSPCVDDDSFLQINHNLAGSLVGFCDLVKKAKDQKNELWVAEATENSSYFLSFDFPRCSHLKSAAASVQRISSLSIQKLKEKVLFIIGECKD
ncbi:protein BREAST CANCER SUSCEPTIBILITY 2 homolog B isoform X3 [Carica papaya]|uniref:protein BREAST CANCER SUSCEPTIBILITY 2 homolog B isoform X3 n=1 Tax=Carica papaya TaxID=3649 RepID=UPI000B8C9595|nr:protein BREAST CANCER SUSCEPTIBILITY 2 homolog B isoform X3 [Carica papaya]